MVVQKIRKIQFLPQNGVKKWKYHPTDLFFEIYSSIPFQRYKNHQNRTIGSKVIFFHFIFFIMKSGVCMYVCMYVCSCEQGQWNFVGWKIYEKEHFFVLRLFDLMCGMDWIDLGNRKRHPPSNGYSFQTTKRTAGIYIPIKRYWA